MLGVAPPEGDRGDVAGDERAGAPRTAAPGRAPYAGSSRRGCPRSASRSSVADVEEMRGRIAVASDTVTMACGTIMMSRLLE